MATGYERLQANQAMQMGGAQQRMGLLDLFPALGQWVQGNRDALMQPYRERANLQADSLLGAPAASAMQTGADGLTSGVSTHGSGLMSDPDDYANKMRYAQGLMGTPGFESAGLQFMNQAVAHQTGADQRKQAQENWQQTEARQKEAQRLQREQQQTQNNLANTRADKTAYNTMSGGMFDDAQKQLGPLREGAVLFDTVQASIKERGFAGQTLADNIVQAKAVAKLLLPPEAVMSDDITMLAQQEGIDGALKATFLQLGMGKPLGETAVRNLYDQMQQLGGKRMEMLQQTRQDFTEMAARQDINAEDVLLSQIGVDMTDYRGPKKVADARGNMSTGVLASDGNAAATTGGPAGDGRQIIPW